MVAQVCYYVLMGYMVALAAVSCIALAIRMNKDINRFIEGKR